MDGGYKRWRKCLEKIEWAAEGQRMKMTVGPFCGLKKMAPVKSSDIGMSLDDVVTVPVVVGWMSVPY